MVAMPQQTAVTHDKSIAAGADACRTGLLASACGRPQTKTAAEAAVFEVLEAYFTPCISRWISGAIRNSSTPGITSAQKPKV